MARDHAVRVLRGGVEAQHEAGDAADRERRIELLGQARRLERGGPISRSWQPASARVERLVQRALTLRRGRS